MPIGPRRGQPGKAVEMTATETHDRASLADAMPDTVLRDHNLSAPPAADAPHDCVSDADRPRSEAGVGS